MTGPIQRNRNVSQSKSASNTMYKISSRNSRSNFGSEGRIRTFIQATLLITMLTFTFFWMKLSIEEMYFHPFELHNKNLNQFSLSLVTIVLPSVVNPNGRGERLKAIADTWGPSSKAVFVVHADEELPIPDSSSWNEFDLSSMTSISYPAVMRLPEGITEKQGVERLIYVLNALKNGPEFTFFVNDHTFVIPEHLCLFLQNYNGEKDDLYAGHALANTGITYGFNSGASGYVLTKLTLGKLVDAIAEEKDHCTGDKNGWLAGNPGIMTADCLGVTLETRPFDTRTKNGEHIFHAYGLVRTVMGSFDEWYLKKHKNLYFRGESDTDEDHIPSGERCCGEYSISFHYVEYTETRKLFEARKYISESSKMGHPLSDGHLMNWLNENWPKQNRVGGYSRPIPEGSAERKQIISVLRKISHNGSKLPQQCSSMAIYS